MSSGLLGVHEGEERIKSRAEADFQYAHFGQRAVSQSRPDEYVFRFGERPFHGMIVFVQFFHEQGVASVGSLFDLYHSSWRFVQLMSRIVPNAVMTMIA